MNLRIAAAGAAAAVMICAGCREVAGPVATDLGSRASVWLPDSTAILAHSDFSSYGTATRTVVSDAVTWALAWNRICGGVQPPPPKPAVDFGAERVLVVALGQRYSGGFDIHVDSVVQFQSGTRVYLTTSSPGSNAITIAVLTAPVQAVRVPAPREPVVFEERHVGP